MRRVILVILILSLGTVVGRGQVSCSVLATQPACDVSLLPGPTADTLEIVAISGTDITESAGQLRLTTVLVDQSLGWWEWVRNHFNDRVEIVDRDVIYPPDTTVEEVAERNDQLMQDSQASSSIAALSYLGYDIEGMFLGASIVSIEDGAARGTELLQEGDLVVAVDGEPVQTANEAVAAVQTRSPGDTIVVTIQRGGQTIDVELVANANPDDPSRALLGVVLQDEFEMPFDIEVDAGDIGGPSAGLMFALAIVDRLEEVDLTGGLVVAGTGTISSDGAVGAIGGVQQKVLGATTPRDEDEQPATVFLVPRGNFEEARGAAVDRQVLLVPVGSLQEAVEALLTLRDGGQPVDAQALGPA